MSHHPIKPTNRSILASQEVWLRSVLLKKIPLSVTTKQLTLCTIFWAALILVSYLFSLDYPGFLHLSSIIIILQYLTDILDGELGRQRGTGLVRWGFYMDHFLDLLFLGAVAIGIYLHLSSVLLLVVMAIFSLLFFNSVMKYHFFSTFSLSAGPVSVTELRFATIILNTLLFFGQRALSQKAILVFAVILVTIVILDSISIEKRLRNS